MCRWTMTRIEMASLSNRSVTAEAPATPKLHDRRARVVRGSVDVTHRMTGEKTPICISFVLFLPIIQFTQPIGFMASTIQTHGQPRAEEVCGKKSPSKSNSNQARRGKHCAFECPPRGTTRIDHGVLEIRERYLTQAESPAGCVRCLRPGAVAEKLVARIQ